MVPDRLLRVKEVCELLGCSSMQLWRLRNDKDYERLNFPKPVGYDRNLRWNESEVRAWISTRKHKPMRPIRKLRNVSFSVRSAQ